MHFEKLRAALVRELGRPGHVRAFNEARPRHAVLQPFGSLADALVTIVGLGGKYGRVDGTTIDAFLRALLDEHTHHPHAAWTAALMAAFFPAATNVKLRARSSAHDDDAIRDLVLMGCLEAIAEVALVRDRDRLPMRIRQAMQRHVHEEIRAVCAEREIVRDLVTVALSTGAMEPFASGRSLLQPHAGELLAEIREAALLGREGDAEQLTSALGTPATQRCFIRLTLPGLLEEDQEQLYQRVKRRRTRALERVKNAAARAAEEASDTTTESPIAPRGRRRKGSR